VMDEVTEFDGFMAAVSSGSRREALEALRAKLAEACLLAEPRELAPLARQLQIVLESIEALTVVTGSGVAFLDQLGAKRAARESGSAAL
jgi:hypothetical protein